MDYKYVLYGILLLHFMLHRTQLEFCTPNCILALEINMCIVGRANWNVLLRVKMYSEHGSECTLLNTDILCTYKAGKNYFEK